MDKYYDLLLEGKFDIVEKEIKELLEKDNQNSELWYLLFLSSNNNYINLDKDNIKNEIVFNKAIEYATFSDEIKYRTEYYLYTNLFILPGFDKIFRLYQFKKYDKVNELLNELNNNYNVNINNKLLDSIKVILGNYSSTIEYKIQLKIYELLYKYSNNEKIIDIINNLKNDNYYNYLEKKEQKQNEINNYHSLSVEEKTNDVKSINVPLIEEKYEKKKYHSNGTLESILQYSAIFLPILTSIIFGIILFSNKTQIDIKSSFAGWCTGWVFYLVASIIFTIFLFNSRRVSNYNDKFSRISATVVFLVVSIFVTIVICNSCKLSSNFYPPNDIKIEFTSLEHTTQSSNYNETKVHMTLSNNGDVYVSYFIGDLVLYNNDKVVWKGTLSYDNGVSAGQTKNVTVTFQERDSDSLYNTSFSDLRAVYSITLMMFDNYKEYNYHDHSVVIK